MARPVRRPRDPCPTGRPGGVTFILDGSTLLDRRQISPLLQPQDRRDSRQPGCVCSGSRDLLHGPTETRAGRLVWGPRDETLAGTPGVCTPKLSSTFAMMSVLRPRDHS